MTHSEWMRYHPIYTVLLLLFRIKTERGRKPNGFNPPLSHSSFALPGD